jgi:copper oxidase (laccase) domain-containing protein
MNSQKLNTANHIKNSDVDDNCRHCITVTSISSASVYSKRQVHRLVVIVASNNGK